MDIEEAAEILSEMIVARSFGIGCFMAIERE